mmetsp:Transcript_47748/g.91298  ORF Transcript_47748/g.91298 Transcript_47748/m.91298 type:complete len:208 (-) Transcript_47748:1330-1953(-)
MLNSCFFKRSTVHGPSTTLYVVRCATPDSSGRSPRKSYASARRFSVKRPPDPSSISATAPFLTTTSASAASPLRITVSPSPRSRTSNRGASWISMLSVSFWNSGSSRRKTRVCAPGESSAWNALRDRDHVRSSDVATTSAVRGATKSSATSPNTLPSDLVATTRSDSVLGTTARLSRVNSFEKSSPSWWLCSSGAPCTTTSAVPLSM